MRSGFVAVAGRPNVGKSTLVNALAGEKLAIVSDKPQTTRRRISAVVNGEAEGEPFQLVLVDLPGFQRPRDALTERMQRTVNETLADVDAFLFVLSASERIGAGDRFIAERIFAAGPPVVIALNKVDRIAPARIAEQITEAAPLGDFHALHPVSALKADGLEPLLQDLVALLPEGPAYFDEGTRTDLPLEARIAEIVREKALALTREEVPHAITVEVDELDLEKGRIRALVWVETESQKGILIGKGGSMIKTIGIRARQEIEALLGRKVFLDLGVKVRPSWRRDVGALERLGI
ncbi:MAG TPA: GTPase Era [Gaiellaceae bacterium]|nr:GTPase Era [Gaiellaceae bacterium]